MAIYVKKSGSFENIGYLYHKESDTWVQIQAGYHKINGEWVKIYPGEFVKSEESDSKTVEPAIYWSTREAFSGGSSNNDLSDGARPLNLQAGFLKGGVDLSWEVFNPNLVEKYEIHRSDEPDGTYSKIGESASKQFVDNSIQGVYKFYKVRSVLESDGGPAKFTEFSDPEYGHVVDIEIDETNITYSSPALTTIEGNVNSFDQAESARAAVKWKKSSGSSFDNEKNAENDVVTSDSETLSLDLKVKYSSSPSSSLYADNPGVNDGNGSGSFDKIVSNGNYIATKTEQAVRLWDFSYNLKDTVTYPDETSDPGSNAIKDVAIRDDGYIGIAKRNDGGDSNAVEVYEIDENENLNLIFEDSEPGGPGETSDLNYGYSVTFHQSSGDMAVGNVDAEIFYYNSSFESVERRDYSFTSSSLNEFYRLGYREYDGMLYAIRKGSDARDPLLIIDSSRNVLNESLGTEDISVADWNNFDGPNAGYLVGVDKEGAKFHVWDDTLTKVDKYGVIPNDESPTSIHWRPDGGVVLTFDDDKFFNTYDKNFNLVQEAFETFDTSIDSPPLSDSFILPNNELFVSYEVDTSNSSSNLKMLSSFEIESELTYNTNYDVKLGVKADETFYPPNSDNTFNTNIPPASTASPSNVTFEAFKVESNQKRKVIDLSWEVSDTRTPDGYNIYRSSSQNGSYAQIANVTGGNSYSDSPGLGEYFYYVQIVESGTEYNQSSTKSAELKPTNRMHILDRRRSHEAYIREFRLTDVWDLDEAALKGEGNLNRTIGAGLSSQSFRSPQSFCFNDDGTKLFLLRDSQFQTAGVWELELETPYDVSISSLGYQSDTAKFFNTEDEVSFPIGIEFDSDGSHFYVGGEDTMDIYEYQLGTPWDITTTSFVQSVTLDDPNQSGEAIVGEVEFKPDGTAIFAILDSGDIAKFNLSTAWDITTANFQHKAEVPDEVDGIYFTDTGSRFYTLTESGTVTENIMKTKWDVTSKVEMNRSQYTATNNNEKVDLNFLSSEDNFNVPRNLQKMADVNEEEVTISWKTSGDADVDYYNVYRSNNSGGSFSKINSSNINDDYYTDLNVSKGERYSYKITSVDTSGNESEFSNELLVPVGEFFSVSSGETATLSDTTKDVTGVQIDGTLIVEGKVIFNIDNFFEVSSSGTINGTGNGFGPGSGEHADGNGPGGGEGQDDDGGIGASYGGRGGTAEDALSLTPYTYGDTQSAEAQKGSAGGNGDGGSVGGAGGAALEVLADSDGFSATVDGIIKFDGQQGQHDGSSTRAGGGGSGGGVYIESEVTGSGTITAKGGDGTSYSNDGGGAGGGGRLKALTFGPNITTDVSGGIIPSGGDGRPGQDGTVAELS